MSLFDLEPIAASKCSPRQRRAKLLAIGRIMKMHTMHGHGPEGATCRGCVHLIERRWSRTYLKCELFRISSSESTDWRAKWPACGKFEPKP